MKTKKLVFLSLLTALALAISLLEEGIPLPFVAPGAKLGLSNLIILVTIVVYGGKAGILVACLKSFLLLLLTGSVTSFFYSMAGALLSSLLMSLAWRFLSPGLSLIGISELGAFSHNLAQLGVASVVLDNVGIFVYLPALTLLGLVTGFFVGLGASSVAPHLQRLSLTQEEKGGFDGKNQQESDQGDAHF